MTPKCPRSSESVSGFVGIRTFPKNPGIYLEQIRWPINSSENLIQITESKCSIWTDLVLVDTMMISPP